MSRQLDLYEWLFLPVVDVPTRPCKPDVPPEFTGPMLDWDQTKAMVAYTPDNKMNKMGRLTDFQDSTSVTGAAEYQKTVKSGFI
jgi:hypothetical protein